MTDLHSISRTSTEPGRPRRRRGWLLGTYAAVVTLIAAGASVGWYAEHQWNPNAVIDEGCTIKGDALLTIEFGHAPGDIVSVRVTSETDRVVVAARAERPPDEDGIRPWVGTTSTYSTMLGATAWPGDRSSTRTATGSPATLSIRPAGTGAKSSQRQNVGPNRSAVADQSTDDCRASADGAHLAQHTPGPCLDAPAS